MALIESLYPELPPSARTIANYIQSDPLVVVSQSVAQIAEKTGTSKATVSRFFRQLGFESHQDAKNSQLSLREKGVPVAVQEASQDYLSQELINFQLTHDGIEEKTIQELATRILKASRVTVVGFRNSYPAALHLRQQLKQMVESVRMIPQPGQTIAEDLLDICENELMILIGFRRRSRIFERMIKQFPTNNTILITDPSGQGYNREVSMTLICHLGQLLPFDSYASAMSLISRIVNTTYQMAGELGVARVNKIRQLYSDLDELEP